jgi:isobutyryl-CoA mutase
MRAVRRCCRRRRGIKHAGLGITGTGGAGKSSLTDELILRLRLDQEDRLRVAIISIDPSRKRTGGALLGDRIRMNAIDSDKIFMRSLATRDTGTEISAALPEVLAACKLSGFDLIVVETSGIGQGESAIVPLVDTVALRDDAGVRRGLAAREDRHARFCRLRRHQQVRPQGRRGCAARRAQAVPAQPRIVRQSPRLMPVYGTMASRFNDDGVTALYQAICRACRRRASSWRRASCRRSR